MSSPINGEESMDTQTYIKGKTGDIVRAVYMGLNNAVVFAEQHIPELTDAL